MSENQKRKIVIIGAGPAGLTTAYKLLENNGKQNYDVLILEASDSIGGISRTVNHNGNRMDIGGHRFFSKNQEVVDFWNKIMPLQGADAYDDKILHREKQLSPGGPDPETEDRVMLIRQRISRIYYLRKFFDYPVSLKMSTLKNMGIINTFKVGTGYLKSTVFKKKETSLENFYINRFGKKLYSMFFEGYTEKLWGRHPSEISADWGAQRVKGLSIIAIIKDMFSKPFKKSNKNTETSLIEEFYYPKYGPGQLWETVAKEIEKMGGHISKNTKVEKIVKKEGIIDSLICKKNGETLEIVADIFVSSMPLKDLILGFNSAPLKINQIALGLPYRDFSTIGILVPKLEIKNETKIKTMNNIVPDCWIYVQEPDIKMGRIQIFNNWSPYMVHDKSTVWIGLEYFCQEGDDFWNMSAEQAVTFAKQELIKMGILNKNSLILDYHKENVQKAYPAYFDSYARIDEVIEYINKIPNLFCVGRNGQHRYNNMDHSMLTGMITAKCIKENKTDKTAVWNVNTEKEYHEEKSA